jgi:hypothetical protein
LEAVFVAGLLFGFFFGVDELEAANFGGREEVAEDGGGYLVHCWLLR